MSICDLLTYRIASAVDCDSLVELVNISYRGELASQGWTNENELVDGLRTNKDAMDDTINNSASIILMFFEKNEQILIGCISLEHKPEIKTAYLGMLTVRPDLQVRGYGKFILSVGEKYVISNWNVDYIEMTVVIQRTELVAFYNRRGYKDIGQRQSFSLKFGSPKQGGLEFATLKKCVKMSEE
jgi:ribosomal protein S18 acetylase RimI-like enzyme